MMINIKTYNKMQGFVTIFILFISVEMAAQISGMGSTSPANSTVLEVSSDEKLGGVLFPRVELANKTDTNTIPNPATGLMAYNLTDNGTGGNEVEANRIYFWNGTEWRDIADKKLTRRLLLPPVFFAQCEGNSTEVTITGGNLTNLNNGSGFTVPFPNNSVLVNNYNNITLNSNNTFTVNNAGDYELSAFLNYCPRVINGYNNEEDEYNEARTALEFRIQQSTNNGTTWSTVATSRSTWSILTGSFFRNVLMPPLIMKNLSSGDRLRLVIARPNNYGGAHGNNGSTVEIATGDGTIITRNIRMLKID